MKNCEFSIHVVDGIKIVNFQDVIRKHGSDWYSFARDEYYFVYKNTECSNTLGILYDEYERFLTTLSRGYDELLQR